MIETNVSRTFATSGKVSGRLIDWRIHASKNELGTILGTLFGTLLNLGPCILLEAVCVNPLSMDLAAFGIGGNILNKIVRSALYLEDTGSSHQSPDVRHEFLSCPLPIRTGRCMRSKLLRLEVRRNQFMGSKGMARVLIRCGPLKNCVAYRGFDEN